MNTPAHIAASLLAGRKLTGWGAVSALAGGAVMPDAMMFVFYGYQKWNGQPEKAIWSELYFTDQWQLIFDLFNSIPIFLFLAIGCYLLKLRWFTLFFASALLHVLCDLPVHNDDAHRHFLPLTHWRFFSPVSYWDPKLWTVLCDFRVTIRNHNLHFCWAENRRSSDASCHIRHAQSLRHRDSNRVAVLGALDAVSRRNIMLGSPKWL